MTQLQLLLVCLIVSETVFLKAADNITQSDHSPQVTELLKIVRGKRVAFVTNHTGVDSKLNFLAEIVAKEPGTTISAFFAPEHGIRGDVQAGGKITDYADPQTSVMVYSLYGARRAPEASQLAATDVLVFDIQDVGVRFYTFMWTMTYAMEAAAQNRVKFVVYDRPNPINGLDVEGPPNNKNASLVGRVWEGQSVGFPIRHGLTVGEVATLVNAEWMATKAELYVVKVPGWKRSHYFEETGLPWVAPSPNMPAIDTAVVYPGTCIFEGTNLSEGRGTTKPFETIGAPFIDGVRLANNLNEAGLPGVRFRPAYFTPTFSKYENVLCGGVQIHVLDREQFKPVRTGLYVLKAIKALYPEQTEIKPRAGTLVGDTDIRTRIINESVDAIIASWEPGLSAFKKLREKHLLY